MNLDRHSVLDDIMQEELERKGLQPKVLLTPENYHENCDNCTNFMANPNDEGTRCSLNHAEYPSICYDFKKKGNPE